MSFIDDVIDSATESGWRHQKTTKGHHKFFSPDGKIIITVSGTPSDHRAEKKIKSDFKRHGLVL